MKAQTYEMCKNYSVVQLHMNCFITCALYYSKQFSIFIFSFQHLFSISTHIIQFLLYSHTAFCELFNTWKTFQHLFSTTSPDQSEPSSHWGSPDTIFCHSHDSVFQFSVFFPRAGLRSTVSIINFLVRQYTMQSVIGIFAPCTFLSTVMMSSIIPVCTTQQWKHY